MRICAARARVLSVVRRAADQPLRPLVIALAPEGSTGEHVRLLAHTIVWQYLPDNELVWQIADIMSDNSARTLAFGMNSALRFDYPVACKTGTSTDFRDNWTVGFTPEFSVGVWVGNFDGAPMREVSGVTGAGPILHAVFDYLHTNRGTSWYRPPVEIVERNVHPLTGKLLADSDSRGRRRGRCRAP